MSISSTSSHNVVADQVMNGVSQGENDNIQVASNEDQALGANEESQVQNTSVSDREVSQESNSHEEVKNDQEDVVSQATENNEEMKNSKVKDLASKIVNFLKQNKKSIIICGTLLGLGLGILSVARLILVAKHRKIYQDNQSALKDPIVNLLKEVIESKPSSKGKASVQTPNVQIENIISLGETLVKQSKLIPNRTKIDSKSFC